MPDSAILQYFPRLVEERTLVELSYRALADHGFTADNTIAAVCVCRDEISQLFPIYVKEFWGEAFNLSSLGAMFTAGKTGLGAILHHAPHGERERYIFYSMTHIAIDAAGNLGTCTRKGIEESVACGALHAFLQELRHKRATPAMDEDDIEQSFLRRRLLPALPPGAPVDLLELTRVARKVVLDDFERALASGIDTGHCDYALLSGIQVHAARANHIWPATFYAVLGGKKLEIQLA